MDTMAVRYQNCLRRYVTALQNEKPDCIPIRPFVAEFTARYSGFTCQQVTHDYRLAFEAVCQTVKDFDWDAVVPNMVYVWTGLAHALGLKYYSIPGIDLDPNTGFQYKEPSEDQAFMREDEYDDLIADPTGFLYEKWLPRVAGEVVEIGKPAKARTYQALVKTAMAMYDYFYAFGPQIERLKTEYGTASAIAGIFKAPLDIIADKLRGYIGLTMDLLIQPDKVLKACEALMPHLYYVAKTTADPEKLVPIGFWMHRGCTPFVTREQFHKFYWPTLKPIIEELWRDSHQVLFYAEGNWDDHLESFAELPEKSIVFHIDRSSPEKAQKVLGEKFCLSGGLSNVTLAVGSPRDVREQCKKLIKLLGKDGGYIMDASAIIQNDAKIENVQAFTEATREYGIYDGPAWSGIDEFLSSRVSSHTTEAKREGERPSWLSCYPPAGVCLPWEEKRKEISEIKGDEFLVEQIWNMVESHGYTFIWQMLLSF